MLAACRVPNSVVTNATRLLSRDGDGAQAAAADGDRGAALSLLRPLASGFPELVGH